jgi:hypothetical protein
MNSKAHLTSEGFYEILKIKQSRESSEDSNSLVETLDNDLAKEGDSFIKSNSTQEGLLQHCPRIGGKKSICK